MTASCGEANLQASKFTFLLSKIASKVIDYTTINFKLVSFFEDCTDKFKWFGFSDNL
jgi:hypothetical protein